MVIANEIDADRLVRIYWRDWVIEMIWILCVIRPLSQWRYLSARNCECLGVWVTARACAFWICWTRFSWVMGMHDMANCAAQIKEACFFLSPRLSVDLKTSVNKSMFIRIPSNYWHRCSYFIAPTGRWRPVLANNILVNLYLNINFVFQNKNNKFINKFFNSTSHVTHQR